MEITPELIVFLGVLLGCLARTLYPYLQKAKEATANKTELKFNWAYGATFGVAFFESLIVVLLLFTKVPIDSTLSPIYLFISSFGWAYTTNDIANRQI